MRTLSTTAIEEKNKLASTGVWLVALLITIPSSGSNIYVRVVRDSDDMTWQGETWVAFPFEIDDITEESTGEVPQVNVRVSNVSRVLESYLQEWDTYTKNNGFSPITVNIYVVNSVKLAADPNCDPEVEHEFELKQPTTDSRWATFRLGAANPFNQRFPLHRIIKTHCRFRFKGDRCGYAGTESSCNKTLPRCRELDNSERYGGFPGAGRSSLQIWQSPGNIPKDSA